MSGIENKKNQSSGWYKDEGESPQVDTKNLRGAIREEDSSYVKLSKQGGLKDLLHHNNQIDKSKPPVIEPNSPLAKHDDEWAKNQGQKNKMRNNSRSAPFATSDNSQPETPKTYGKKIFNPPATGEANMKDIMSGGYGA